MTDLYKTIAAPATGIYKEKGSKFLSYAYPVFSDEEINNHLSYLRNRFFDARHHCYAYMLKADKSVFRANDDGEPANTGGKPILGQIYSKDLTNILIVVVRYFGGTLLGVSGLINAYRTASADALNNAQIREQTEKNKYEVLFRYSEMNEVMKILKDEKIDQSEQQFDLECALKINIRKSKSDEIIHKLRKIGHVNIKYILTL